MNNPGKEEKSATGDGKRTYTEEELRERKRQKDREWRRNLPEEKRLYLQRRNLERRRIRSLKARENTDDQQRLAEKHARTLRQESYRKWCAQVKEEKREIQIQPPNDDGIVYVVMAEEAEAGEAQMDAIVQPFTVECGLEGVTLTDDGSGGGGGFVCVSKLETSEPEQVETVVAGHPVPAERDHREGVIAPDSGSEGGDQQRLAEEHARTLLQESYRKYRKWRAQVKEEKREIQIQPLNDDDRQRLAEKHARTLRQESYQKWCARVKEEERKKQIQPFNDDGFVCVSKLETSEPEQVETVVAGHPLPAERDHCEGVIAPDNGSGGGGSVWPPLEPPPLAPIRPCNRESNGSGGGGFVCVSKLETSEPEQVETVVAGILCPQNGTTAKVSLHRTTALKVEVTAVCIVKVEKAEPEEVDTVVAGYPVPAEWDHCEGVIPARDCSEGVKCFIKAEAAEPEQMEEVITGLPPPEEQDFEGALAPDDGSGGPWRSKENETEEERRARRLLKDRERSRMKRARKKETEILNGEQHTPAEMERRAQRRERDRMRRAKAKEDEERRALILLKERERARIRRAKAKEDEERRALILLKERERARIRRAKQKEEKKQILNAGQQHTPEPTQAEEERRAHRLLKEAERSRIRRARQKEKMEQILKGPTPSGENETEETRARRLLKDRERSRIRRARNKEKMEQILNGQQHTPEPTQAEEERRAQKLLKDRERSRIRRAREKEILDQILNGQQHAPEPTQAEEERAVQKLLKERERARIRRAREKEILDQILNGQQLTPESTQAEERRARKRLRDRKRSRIRRAKEREEMEQVLNDLQCTQDLSRAENHDRILRSRYRNWCAQVKEEKREMQIPLLHEDGQEFMPSRTPERCGEESQQSPERMFPDAARAPSENEDEEDSADLKPPLPIETVWLEDRFLKQEDSDTDSC